MDAIAKEETKKHFTCQLCGEAKESTDVYCGGPVAYMCEDCYKIVAKYREMEEAWKKKMKKLLN